MSESKEIQPYKYFDTPDGSDVFQKLMCVMKPAALWTIGVGTVDVLTWSHPKGYMPTLGRYLYVGFPILGVSSTFVLATNAAASLRKKDDRWNWFIGGFASGSVLGLWRSNVMFGFNCGMFFGLLAVCRKIAVENNWVVNPTGDVPVASQNCWNYDFSLRHERPGNWTTGKD